MVIRHHSLGRALLPLLALFTGIVVAPRAAGQASPLPAIVVTGVIADNSSVKIDFQPVPGARDYRVFDVGDPMMVKYAGMRHLDAGMFNHFVMQADGVTPVFPYATAPNWMGGNGPRTLDVPATEIEWNKMGDGQPHILVVQAVDALGPAPSSNLYDDADAPLHMPAGTLGVNEGATADGNISINGQGPPTNTPHVIAQSLPFVAQANASLRALPSRPDATQTFFDTFDSSENDALRQVGPVNARTGVMTYTLNAGTPHAWDTFYQGADTDHSMPMVMDGHFMDVLFDGATPSSLPPGLSAGYHVQYSTMAMSPQPTADLSGGKLLHLTEEVDGHLDGTYRWLAWQLAPATDPITDFRADNYITTGFAPTANTMPVNHSDKALWMQVFAGFCDAMLFEGPSAITSTVPITNAFLPVQVGSVPPCLRTGHLGGNGNGLDNRERWDVFLTARHLAIFEDGQMIGQSDIPDGGLPFDHAKLYFSHYLYATATPFEPTTIRNSEPWETYWRDVAPHSDERHWDNMGFEVLPASDVPSDWSTLASSIHMAASVVPAVADPTPTATSTATAPPTNTATPLPTLTNASTPTLTNTATPRPSATSTATPRPTNTAAATATAAHPVAPSAPPTTGAPSAQTGGTGSAPIPGPAPTSPVSRPTSTTPAPSATPTPRPRGRATTRQPARPNGRTGHHQPAPQPRHTTTAHNVAMIATVTTTWITPSAPGHVAVARVTLHMRRSGAVPVVAFRLVNARGATVAQTWRRHVTFTAAKPRTFVVSWRLPRGQRLSRLRLQVWAGTPTPQRPRHNKHAR